MEVLTVASLAELIQKIFHLGQIESEILAFLITFGAALVSGWVIYSIFRRYLSRWATSTKTNIDDEILDNIRTPIILLALLFGVYYGLQSLTLFGAYSETIELVFTVAQVLIVTFITARIVSILIGWLAQRATRKRRVSQHILYIMKQIARGIIYVCALLALLAVFEVDLSGLVVGLGVGGIAIALALQTVLSDVFCAFSIFFDRPFEVGDFIVVGGYSGTVKKIGLKSTRLQLLQGEELVISNKELTTTILRNFRKLRRRRVVLTISVDANTPLAKLKRIPAMIAEIIKQRELTEFNRVHFKEFGEFSLNFEVVYYMKSSDYVKYMDTQQEINFAIIEAFEREGVEMPFPTQTIRLQQQSNVGKQTNV
jgi:small-conductance mechanosensitive channel